MILWWISMWRLFLLSFLVLDNPCHIRHSLNKKNCIPKCFYCSTKMKDKSGHWLFLISDTVFYFQTVFSFSGFILLTELTTLCGSVCEVCIMTWATANEHRLSAAFCWCVSSTAWMEFCDHQNDFVVDTHLKRAAFRPEATLHIQKWGIEFVRPARGIWAEVVCSPQKVWQETWSQIPPGETQASETLGSSDSVCRDLCKQIWLHAYSSGKSSTAGWKDV